MSIPIPEPFPVQHITPSASDALLELPTTAESTGAGRVSRLSQLSESGIYISRLARGQPELLRSYPVVLHNRDLLTVTGNHRDLSGSDFRVIYLSQPPDSESEATARVSCSNQLLKPIVRLRCPSGVSWASRPSKSVS
jgi:hypothetical protein